ncbi:MAG: methyltransferase [Bacteroidetes bacterium]|nr:methyltransferase [Bacteroidota bacterium]
MDWQNIKVSADSTHFLFEGKQVFGKEFLEVLKFHSPGLAPVIDITGAYHIDTSGGAIYSERYTKTFGYYCNRAAVMLNEKWFHINELGKPVYNNTFLWSGNYQENICSVRGANNQYFHIDLDGDKIYSETFTYAGDYKDGIACVKTANGFYKHIDTKGNYLNNIEFLDLGVFHKNFATARDITGWHHIDKRGRQLYKERYASVEPFYNGFAVVTLFDNTKIIINEIGKIIVNLY